MAALLHISRGIVKLTMTARVKGMDVRNKASFRWVEEGSGKHQQSRKGSTMRAFIIASVLTTAIIFSQPGTAQINMGVSIGDGDRNEFFLSLGSFYRVPEREVVILREHRLRDEEFPVVFYFAEMARVRPAVIVSLREDGLSWMDIALRFNLGPALFYDPVYGRPHGYDNYRPGRVWGRVRYDDDDFISFCNVRFLSRHYHYRPENIIRMRQHERDYFLIHRDIRHEWQKQRQGRNDRHEQWERHDNGRHEGEMRRGGWNNPGGKPGSDVKKDDRNSGQDNTRKQNPERHRSGSGRD